MTREEKIAAIIVAVNAATDVPFIGEVTEGNAIGWIANHTIIHLNDRALDAILNVSDGLSDAEIAMLTDVLTSFINQAVDIPWVPETVEDMAIRQAVAFILSKAKEGISVIQQ